MQPLHLQIDRNLSPTATAKAAGLSELAAQFAIGAFQQRSGAHELAGDATQGIEGNRLFKIPLQGCYGFWCLLLPGVHHRTQARARGVASRLDKWHWLAPATARALADGPLRGGFRAFCRRHCAVCERHSVARSRGSRTPGPPPLLTRLCRRGSPPAARLLAARRVPRADQASVASRVAFLPRQVPNREWLACHCRQPTVPRPKASPCASPCVALP